MAIYARDEAKIMASVGSKSDNYDNALAESFNGFYKAGITRSVWIIVHCLKIIFYE
jgi:hypothetical protein